MPKFNIDRIRQIIGEVNSSLHKLDGYAELLEENFLSNADKVDSAKYNLIVAIEGAIDICNHIVVKAGGRAPNDHADCFEVLRELKLLQDDFVERLKSMAKFRNLLVHLYWKADNRKVYQILQKDTRDIKEFISKVNNLISPD
ncbi:MAG: DUF86 domain-containing protein [Candidatus Aminicenantes bacterium]|nr:DUF86 domain-containing protein [Candidatus Aminicenantes bacterium]